MSSLDTPPIIPRIEEELAGLATQVAPSSWLASLFTRNGIDVESSSDYLNQSTYYKCSRWDFPQVDDGEDQYSDDKDDVDRWKKFNDRVQHRFMDILSDIIYYFGFGDTRRVLATDGTSDERDDIYLKYDETSRKPDYSTRPDLVILGQDSKQLPRSLVSYSAAMSIDEEDRRELYRGCVAVGKVERRQRRGKTDRKLEKAAYCARECFKQQPNRRFVYAFSVTVDAFQLFYFDRGGAVYTETVDIHQEAASFVQLVRFLANPDLSTLGFDRKVYWDGDHRCMDILSGDRVIKYTVDRVLFHHPALFGGGSNCWIGREVGAKTDVVIKDKWRRKCCDSEGSLLTTAWGAAISGVTCLLAVDETFTTEPLTTLSLRQSQCIDIPADKDSDKAFSRIIMEFCGPSIEHFGSGLQLLQALRDSIQTHYQLVKASVLHRDISVDNIRLGPSNASPGQRGILLDLAQGSHCERGKPPPDKDVYIGTFMFRSVYDLVKETAEPRDFKRRQSHDFLDDLESFFWVYAWIMTVHNGPGKNRLVPESERSIGARFWEKKLDPDFHRCWKRPYILFFDDPRYTTFTPYFSKPVYQTLLNEFRSLLRHYLDQKMKQPVDEDEDEDEDDEDGDGDEAEAKVEGEGEDKGQGQDGNTPELDFFPEMDEIYTKVLGFFDVAIKAVSPAHKLPARSQPDRQVKLAKRRREEDSTPSSLPKAKKSRLNQPARQRKRQRDEVPASLPKPKRVRIDLQRVVVPPADVSQKATASIPQNLRRSSRLKTGR